MVAAEMSESVEFHWIIDEPCNGRWSDIFLPHASVLDVNKPHGKYDFEGQGTVNAIIRRYFPEYIQADGLQELIIQHYCSFRIRSDLLQTVKEIIPKCAYHSIHVRRTDHVELAMKAGKFTDLTEFDTFVNCSRNSNYPVYLATDAREVQDYYFDAVKYKMIPENNACLRPTSLRDAMVDILACAFAEKFKGSGYSSYSKLIEIYRTIIRLGKLDFYQN